MRLVKALFLELLANFYTNSLEVSPAFGGDASRESAEPLLIVVLSCHAFLKLSFELKGYPGNLFIKGIRDKYEQTLNTNNKPLA